MNKTAQPEQNRRYREVSLKMEHKTQVAENLWLHYFNQELYHRNLITEAERKKMITKIESRKIPFKAKKP